MRIYKSDRIRFIFGLIFIIIIYSAYYLFFIDNLKWRIPRRVGHLGVFTTTIIVYFTGTFHLGKLSDSWMSSLWHIIHISGLCILTVLGIYHWFISDIGPFLLSFGQSIQEMLISPMLYVAMGLINSSLKTKS